MKRKILHLLSCLSGILFPGKQEMPEAFIGKGIEFAFESGGKRYYRYADVYQMPLLRAKASAWVYELLELKCSHEYLNLFSDEIIKLIVEPKQDKGKIIQLCNDLKVRLSMTVDPEVIWLLASVMFFDETENLKTWDLGYAKQKIEFWKKNGGLEDFFFGTPLREYLPFMPGSKESLTYLLEKANRRNEQHYSRFSSQQ